MSELRTMVLEAEGLLQVFPTRVVVLEVVLETTTLESETTLSRAVLVSCL
jgi:hypothetical protein